MNTIGKLTYGIMGAGLAFLCRGGPIYAAETNLPAVDFNLGFNTLESGITETGTLRLRGITNCKLIVKGLEVSHNSLTEAEQTMDSWGGNERLLLGKKGFPTREKS